MSMLLRTAAPAKSALRSKGVARLASTQFVRGKATLPDLPYDYAALEPAISGRIMELHHSKHHQTYVNGYNDAQAKLADAQAQTANPQQQQAVAALLPLLNFHGGGHANHSLFWENLAPKGKGGGEPPSGKLGEAISGRWGGLDGFKGEMTKALAGIQGSGWAWLVKDKTTGDISIRTYANQDPVVGQYTPLLGIDAWEHAYYLDYQNRKAEYFNAIFDVLNWSAAEKRYDA